MPSFIARAREYLGWCPHSAGIHHQPVRDDAYRRGPLPGVAPDPVTGDRWAGGILYRHTQFGRVQVWASLAAILIIALSVVYLGPYWISIAAGIILGAAILFFGSLTVMVNRGDLVIQFGAFGIVNRVVPLAAIAAVQVVETPWYYGWGVRWTPEGRLYNICGTAGIEVTLHDGTKFRIGTDDPGALAQAIRDQLHLPIKRALSLPPQPQKDVNGR